MAAKSRRKKAIQFQIGWPGLIALIISFFCAFLWVFVLGFWMGQKVATGNRPKDNITVYNPKSSSLTDEGKTQDLIDEANIHKSLAIKELDQIKQEIKKEAEGDIETELLSEPSEPSEKSGEVKVTKKEQSQPEQTPANKQEQKPKEEKKAEKESKKKEVKAEPNKATKTEKTAKAKSKPKIKQKKKIETEKITPSSFADSTLKRYFALQIASYRRFDQAKKEANAWKKRGYFVQIIKANLGRKGVWYRVYIGKYKTLEEAKNASIKLATREGIRSYVTRFEK